MAKWADYGISAVRYNTTHKHIIKVKAHVDNGETIGSAVEYERQQIVDAIKKGTTYVTIIMNSDGKWSKGQPVFIIKINGVEYIKTVDNSRESDNLENLPEF